MPHIEMKCFPGRTEEQKNASAEKIAQAIADTMGCGVSHVSVSIEEVPQKDWKEQVWDVEIAPKMDTLYFKPGYTCE